MAKLRIAKWEAKEGNNLTSNGLIRINPNKPEFGSLMLISTTFQLGKGFGSVKPKVGFITGRVNELDMLLKEYNLKEGDDFSAKVSPSRIITVEKLESEVPENQGFRPKMNPSTGELLTKDGEQIYWKTEVVSEGSDQFDQFVQHDVITEDESVREFQAEEATDEK